MKTMLLIRHGRSLHNIKQTDDLDSPITDFGIEQALALGGFMSKKIKDLETYTLHVSPFLRTLMTTHYMMEGAQGAFDKNKVVIDCNVAEYLHSESPSVSVKARESEFPFDWSGYFQDTRVEDGLYTHHPENDEMFLQRIAQAHDNLSEKSIAVSHAMTIYTLGHYAQGQTDSVPTWDYSINNCSITRIENGKKLWWGRNLHHETDQSNYRSDL